MYLFPAEAVYTLLPEPSVSPVSNNSVYVTETPFTFPVYSSAAGLMIYMTKNVTASASITAAITMEIINLSLPFLTGSSSMISFEMGITHLFMAFYLYIIHYTAGFVKIYYVFFGKF